MSHDLRRVVFRSLLVLLGLVMLLAMTIPAARAAGNVPDGATLLAQQVSPYQAPEVLGKEVPGWLAPLGPIAGFPLWAQASLASAAVAAAFFILPAFGRGILRVVRERRLRQEAQG